MRTGKRSNSGATMRSSDTSRNWRYIRSRAWKRKQLAALNLEIDRQVNDQLSRAGVVACGNRESDKSGSSKMPPELTTPPWRKALEDYIKQSQKLPSWWRPTMLQPDWTKWVSYQKRTDDNGGIIMLDECDRPKRKDKKAVNRMLTELANSKKLGPARVPPMYLTPGKGKTHSTVEGFPEYTGTKPHRKAGTLIWKHRKKLDKKLRKHGVKVKTLEVTLRVREEDDEG